jgi:tRNA 2-thiouridine synthesizing protein A
MPEAPEIRILDATGHRCPIPVILMERELRLLPPGAVLKVLADDPLAAVDIPHFADARGAFAVRVADENGACVFLVTGQGNPPL